MTFISVEDGQMEPKTAVRSGHGILITDSGPQRSGAPSLEPLPTGSLRVFPIPALDRVSLAWQLDVSHH